MLIHVIATITAREGQREALLAEFHRIVPLVHAEKGCVEYGPAIDVASGISVQAPVRENVVVVIEKWETIEALKAHTQAPHMAEYRARVRDIVESVSLQILGTA